MSVKVNNLGILSLERLLPVPCKIWASAKLSISILRGANLSKKLVKILPKCQEKLPKFLPQFNQAFAQELPSQSLYQSKDISKKGLCDILHSNTN